jgi:hypothetical protein
MKLSTEAIVAAAVAVIFAVLSLGAIAREKGEPRRGGHNRYVAASTASVSYVDAGDTGVLGFY